MVEKVAKIWMDGELVDWDDAKVHVLTHSLHYGLGAFEGIRAYKRADGTTNVFRLREHMERLLDSCKLCHLKSRYSNEDLSRASVDLLRQNRLDEAYLRPMIYIGEGAMGVYAPDNPIRAFIVAYRWGAYLGAEALGTGIRVKISSFLRHHIAVSLAKAKTMGQYTNSVLAKAEAKSCGYDEAVLLDTQGYVSEGSGENIFIVKKGRLVAEVTPVREVDDRAIGDGKVGPITKRLQARFFDVVKGSDSHHPEWHTRV